MITAAELSKKWPWALHFLEVGSRVIMCMLIRITYFIDRVVSFGVVGFYLYFHEGAGGFRVRGLPGSYHHQVFGGVQPKSWAV